MFRAVVEEAAALTSIALFLGMIAVWAQVLGSAVAICDGTVSSVRGLVALVA